MSPDGAKASSLSPRRGLPFLRASLPTAYAAGYVLLPLRGCTGCVLPPLQGCAGYREPVYPSSRLSGRWGPLRVSSLT